MSKKQLLILAGLAVGGVGLASMMADSDEGSGAQKTRAGRILGSQQTPPFGSTVYNMPAQAPVTFPKAPTFDISSFLAPVSRGAAGVSSAGKKEVVTPYLYTGGEIKTGATTLAPWAKAPKVIQPYAYTGGEVKTGAVSVAPWAMVSPVTARGRTSSGGSRFSSKKAVKSTPVSRAESSYQKSVSIAYGTKKEKKTKK